MLQTLRENKRLQGTLLILPTLLWMIGLLIIPLLLTLITSFGTRDADGNVIYTFTLGNYARLIGFTETGFDDLYLQIIGRSLLLAFQTTILVILLAYPLAYFIARAPAKRRNTLLFLVLVPLWTNFVIRIYAWIMILRTQGVLNSLLGWLIGLVGGHFQPFDLYPSQGAVLVGMSLSPQKLQVGRAGHSRNAGSDRASSWRLSWASGRAGSSRCARSCFA